MTNPATAAVDLMRREFFSEFPPPDDLDIFVLTDWDDLPPTEKMAWVKAFNFAYKIGMTGTTPLTTLNKEKLAEAVDLCIAILDDLETETEYPTVTAGMAYRAALDSAQQLLETLQQATETKGEQLC